MRDHHVACLGRMEARMEVVATSGTFDCITPSQVDFLRRARSMGDMLVVLIAAQAENNPLWHRIMVLRELRCVDVVIPFDGPSPAETLLSLQPDYYVMGSDYTPEESPERDAVSLWGGHFVHLPRCILDEWTEKKN